MKQTITSLIVLLTMTLTALGQARVQVIHNSADAAAAEVDVYINGSLALDNFRFRTATPFIDLPAGVNINVGIAPANSSSVADTLVSYNYVLADGERYILVANGIVSASGYNPAIPFNIFVYAMGRETGSDPVNTDVLVFHGSTDAPTVDVVETGLGAGTIIDNLTYGDFRGYLSLPTNNYVLEVRDESGTVTVASYNVPLASLGLRGAALTVVASGFLNPASNSNGAAFGLWVALPSGGELIPLPVSTARVQVIHNSADAAAAEVDVYINGSLALDNFKFRTATPFIDLPAGVNINVGIAPASSTSVVDTLVSYNYNLKSGEKYILVANGIVSPSGYSPAIPFDIYVYPLARETGSSASNTDVLVFHGSTDAPTVDVVEVKAGAGTIIDNLSYGNFAGYLSLPTANYVLEVRDESGAVTVASYDAPLADLNLEGAALTVVASGFLNPAANSDGSAFGLWVALPSGGNLIALPASISQLQVIHNSADAAAAEVDVYINGALALDNFKFRTATPFIDLPSGVNINVGIAPSTSTSVADTLVSYNYKLASGERYILVANGIVSPSGYTPAIPFDIFVYTPAKTASDDGALVDLLVFHGSTDAPFVDVVETEAGAGTVIDNLGYGSFSNYLTLPELDYVLEVRDSTGTVTVASYDAPLRTLDLGGNALTVVASGFLNPSANSNGATFGLWVALPTGGELIPLPESKARVQVIHNSADAAAAEVDVYINGSLALDNFKFRTATPFIDLPAGVNINVGIAPANSTSIADTLVSYNYNLASGEKYILIANGIVSPSGYVPAIPFNIFVFTSGKETSGSPTTTDVLVFHGSTDAPTVDVVETLVGAGTVVDNLSYGEYAGYLNLPTANFVLDVRDSSGATTVKSYSAPLADLDLGGAALTVVASGFLNPAVNSDGPAFGLWVALAGGGNLIPLPERTGTFNPPAFNANDIRIYPNPVNYGLLNVEMANNDRIDMVGLFSTSGTLVYRLAMGNNSIGQVRIPDSISKGVYLLQVVTENGTGFQRIVVQ